MKHGQEKEKCVSILPYNGNNHISWKERKWLYGSSECLGGYSLEPF